MACYELEGMAPRLPEAGNFFIADSAAVIGRVEVGIARNKEILVFRAKRGAIALHAVPQDSVRIEVGTEKIALILRSERCAAI